MLENHASLDRRTVLKKSAAATGAVATGLAVTGQAAAAEVTCDIVIEGQGEFDMHLIAGGMSWENLPNDITITNHDVSSGQLVTIEGSVSSDSDGSGDDYFSGTIIDWDEDGYKNGLADDGVTVTICDEERDVDSW